MEWPDSTELSGEEASQYWLEVLEVGRSIERADVEALRG
jgi:hypothetical protein